MQAETTLTDHRGLPASREIPDPLVTRRHDRLAAATGIVFVALQLPIVVLLGDAPAIDDPPTAIRDYLVNDGWRILWAATFSALSAFFFLWFLGSVWATLRNAEGPRARMTPIAVGAGVATITLAVTASLPAVALAWHGTAASADPGLLRAVWNLNTLAFVPIGATAGIFSLAASIVIIRTRVLPAWLGWIGLLETILGVASVFYILADGANTFLGLVNVAGFLVGILFILLLSVLMVVCLGKTEPATAPQVDGDR